MSVTERFGRYVLYPPIAHGGMATVHAARLASPEGSHRLVAAKRLHPELSEDPEFVSMFDDEARIASRIHHPNVVPVLEVVRSGDDLLLVQEYVHGVPLSHLLKQANADEDPIPIHITVAIVSGILAGLHAAHEVKDDEGKPLDIVHRDVSPQNILVSVEGVPRLLDFGIAKARTSNHHTREGVFKGKLAYMAPEVLKLEPVDRTADVYAIGVLLWELLVNRRIFDGRHELGFVTAVMCSEIPKVLAALTHTRETVPDVRLEALGTLEPIVAKAMAPAPRDRFPTADAMLRAIAETDVPSASVREVSAWVKRAGEDYLERRERTLAENEGSWRTTSIRATTVARGNRADVEAILSRPTPSGVIRANPPPLPRASPPPMRIPSPLPKPSPLSPLAITQAPPPLPPQASSPPPLPTRPPASISPMKILDVAPPSLSPIVAPAALHDRADEAPSSSPPPRVATRRRRARELSRFVPWIIVGVLFVITGAVAGVTTVARTQTPTVATAPATQPIVVTTPITAPSVPAEPPPPFLQLPTTTPVPTLAPVTATTARPHPPPPPPPPAVAPPPPRFVAPPPAPAKPSANADCNPPFFFEGTKKVFKPACL